MRYLAPIRSQPNMSLEKIYNSKGFQCATSRLFGLNKLRAEKCSNEFWMSFNALPRAY